MNPFFDPPLLGRNREKKRIISRIVSGSQSVAITGEERMGKSQLMRHLAYLGLRNELYGELGSRMIFSEINAQNFSATLTPTQFWQIALAPLVEKLADIDGPELTSAYETCKAEGFGNFGLERLLAQLQASGWRIVLLLDEFDNLLNHPILHKSEFYGGLRTLATRYESLCIVLASRQPLESLIEATREYSRMGSPYFNFMYQLTLGALSEADSHSFLARGDDYFTRADKDYLFFIAGGHPFLLQTAACALWEAYDEGDGSRQIRWESTASDLLDLASPVLKDTWRSWSPEAKKAITIIAMDTIPLLIAGREFDIDALLKTLSDYSPEIDELKKRGFLVANEEARSGFRLTAQVMIWWLAGELIRITRPSDVQDVGEWLNREGWFGLLKGEEKSQFKKALAALGGLLKTGSESFIKASAKGFAEGLTVIR